MILKNAICTSILILVLSGIVNAQMLAIKAEEKSLILNVDTLYGSLYMPAAYTKNLTAVIIQPGSGPTDRNGNSLPMLESNAYKMLADSLARYQIATLLIDKRGVGESRKAVQKNDTLLFSTYAADLAAWVRYLKQDMRVASVAIIGHSEGSLLGMLAAQQAPVSKFISIAGAGQNIAPILVEQVTRQSSTLGRELDSLLNKIRNNEPVNVKGPLASLLAPSVIPYMKSWMQLEPEAEIAKLKIPILIIQGDNDVQVDVVNATKLVAAAPNSTYALLPGMNHMLKMSPTDFAGNVSSYNDPLLPIPTTLVQAIVNFLNK